MFICDDCLLNYENCSIFRSHGKCEICGDKAVCSEIPSSQLIPKKRPKVKTIGDLLLFLQPKALIK